MENDEDNSGRHDNDKRNTDAENEITCIPRDIDVRHRHAGVGPAVVARHDRVVDAVVLHPSCAVHLHQ